MNRQPSQSGLTPCEINADKAKDVRHTIILPKNTKAFSILELLVIISVIGLLIAVLIPALRGSRLQTQEIVCKNNIRQLIMANTVYADDNKGYFVPAARDILAANKHRWYGARNETNCPFGTTKGPLALYLGNNKINCPQEPAFAKQYAPDSDCADYEEGCGGYGYNMIYLGSRIWIESYEDQSCKSTANSGEVRRPSQTLVFADTAMAKLKNGRLYYVEYSFAEPRYFVIKGKLDKSLDPSPSIHFRHRGQANVGWVDGNISSEKMAQYDGINIDGATSFRLNIGWFEPMANTSFDLD